MPDPVLITPVANPEHARASIRAIQQNIESVIRGQTQVLRLLLSALVSGGHVLLEDFPGTGKTTLARTVLAFAQTIRERRLQEA